MNEIEMDETTTTNEDSGVLSFTTDDSLQRSTLLSSSATRRNNFSDTNFNESSSLNQSSNTKQRVCDIFYCSNYFDLNDILSQTIRLSIRFERTIPKLAFLDSSHDDDQNNQNDDEQQQNNEITIGTKLELPLWIVKELNGDHAVQVKLPKGYNEIYREILEADANCANLYKLSINYYLTGKHLCGMNLNESEDLAKSLLRTFKQRFKRLVNYSLSGNVSGKLLISSINNNNDDDNYSSSTTLISKLNTIMFKNDQTKSSSSSSSRDTTITDETINDLNQFIYKLDNWERELLTIGRQLSQQMKLWENRQLIRIRANDMVINLKKRKILLQST